MLQVVTELTDTTHSALIQEHAKTTELSFEVSVVVVNTINFTQCIKSEHICCCNND